MSQPVDVQPNESTANRLHDPWTAHLKRASELFGRKWQPVIIRSLLKNGPKGFAELKNDIDGISSKVLSENLEDLEDSRLVSREIVQTDPFRVEYSLTAGGAALEPLLRGLIDWSKEYDILSHRGGVYE